MELIPYLFVKCETGEVATPLRARAALAYHHADLDHTAIVRVADARVEHSLARGYHITTAVAPGECPEELL